VENCRRLQIQFVNLSLRLPLNKQGIGIIFIADYFATCFALFGGPIREYDHFDIRNQCKEKNTQRNICKERDYAHVS